jgi:ParB-like nuclease domain
VQALTGEKRVSEAATTKVELVPLFEIMPCKENDTIYGAQSIDDPDIRDLIKSIRAHGVLEPIHISLDNYIISGHRRIFCAIQAGVYTVPVLRRPISYGDDRDAFLKLLIEVLDIDAYNSELEREAKDAVAIKAARNSVIEFMKNLDLDGEARQ